MIKFILNILIRGIKVGYKYDKNIRADINSLPNGYVIKLKIYPLDFFVCFKIENNKILKVIDSSIKENLLIEFKDIKSAKEVLYGKKSIANSFCEHRIKVYGNINNAIALTRIINTVECYLLPKFIYKKLFNPCPKKEINKLKFYTQLLFGGKL